MQIKGIKVEWTQTFEHHCIQSQLPWFWHRLLWFYLSMKVSQTTL